MLFVFLLPLMPVNKDYQFRVCNVQIHGMSSDDENRKQQCPTMDDVKKTVHGR